MNTKTFKERLHQLCLEKVEEQLQSLEQRLAGITESRDNETKSSVGDKYETGRAMLQREEAQIRSQLARIQSDRTALTAIKPKETCTQAEPGALLQTSAGNFFIAVALGKLEIDGQSIYAISMDAPVGQALKGRTTNERVSFKGRTVTIIGIW